MKDIQNYLGPTEVQQILRAAKLRSSSDYLVITLLWQAGIRVSELLHIRPKDRLQPKRIASVKATGDKQRLVPIKPATLPELQAYIQEQGIAADGPLFQNTQGIAYTKQYIRKIVLNTAASSIRNTSAHLQAQLRYEHGKARL